MQRAESLSQYRSGIQYRNCNGMAARSSDHPTPALETNVEAYLSLEFFSSSSQRLAVSNRCKLRVCSPLSAFLLTVLRLYSWNSTTPTPTRTSSRGSSPTRRTRAISCSSCGKLNDTPTFSRRSSRGCRRGCRYRCRGMPA